MAARVVRTERSEILASASVVVAPAALQGLTRELPGERTQVSASAFRSLLLPGWGQFYTRKYARGGISLALCTGALGYTVYAIVKTHNARVEYDDFAAKWQEDPPSGITGPRWWGDNQDGIFYQRKDSIYQEYSEQYDRAVLAGTITGALWSLNVVDAVIAGVQSQRKFQPYFTVDRNADPRFGMYVGF